MSSAAESIIQSSTHETITLQVNIPAGVEVGSTINVLYENNYYQIVVPAGAPGNSIQVVLPNVPVASPIPDSEDMIRNEKTSSLPELSEMEYPAEIPSSLNTANSVSGAAAATTVDGTDGNESIAPSSTMTAAVVGAAVVGAIVIGPLVTGAVVIGGAAVYVASRNKNHNNTTEQAPRDPNSIAGKATAAATQATTKMKEIDNKYEITATATRVVNSGVNKAKEIDEKHKVTETIVVASTSLANKVKETDEKYHITAKAGEMATNTVEAVKQFDEKHQVSATAAATAEKAAAKAKEIDEKYEISASIGRAFTSGVTALGKLTQPSNLRP